MAYMKTLGVEIEYFRIEGDGAGSTSKSETARFITEALESAGYRGLCSVSGYHGSVPAGDWNSTHDGSVHNEDYTRNGAELVSPVLDITANGSGYNELAVVMDTMVARGCTVTKACGLHIHLGIEGIPLEAIKLFVRRYIAHESAVLSMVAPSRRDGNRFCKTFRSQNINLETAEARLGRIQQLSDLPRMFAGRDRYYGLNVCSLERLPTIEIRVHGGTVESKKAIYWARLWASIMDDCVETVLRADRSHAGALVASPTWTPTSTVRPGLETLVSRFTGHRAELVAQLVNYGGLQNTDAEVRYGWLPHTLRGRLSEVRTKLKSMGYTILCRNGWYSIQPLDVVLVEPIPAPAAMGTVRQALPPIPGFWQGVPADVRAYHEGRIAQFERQAMRRVA